MKHFTKEEYIALCEEILNSQYEQSDEESKEEICWQPSLPAAKEKMLKHLAKNMVVDLSTAKREEIKKQLYYAENFRVDHFTIRVQWYDDEKDTFDLALHEERHRTMSGHPCRIITPLNIEDDTRFMGRPWLNYFSVHGDQGRKIPSETVIEIIRFFQALKKLKAFV